VVGGDGGGDVGAAGQLVPDKRHGVGGRDVLHHHLQRGELGHQGPENEVDEHLVDDEDEYEGSQR